MRGDLGHRWTRGERVDRVAQVFDVEVPVGAEGGVDARVAEDPLHAVSIDLRPEQERSYRVPDVVSQQGPMSPEQAS